MRTRDLTIVGWRAWYTEGRVFDSESTAWEDLPEHGLLRVNVYYKTRPCFKKMHGASIYWLEHTEHGPAFCYDNAADAIISDDARSNNRVKYGKWIADTEWERVRLLADESVISPNEDDRTDP